MIDSLSETFCAPFVTDTRKSKSVLELQRKKERTKRNKIKQNYKFVR